MAASARLQRGGRVSCEEGRREGPMRQAVWQGVLFGGWVWGAHGRLFGRGGWGEVLPGRGVWGCLESAAKLLVLLG